MSPFAMRTLALGWGLCLATTIWAQITVQATVVDKLTRAPIPYVNVGELDAKRGTVGDAGGAFTLRVGTEARLVISALGYTSATLTATELSALDTVALPSAAYALPTVDIRGAALENEERIFGVRNETRGRSISFGSPQLGTEIGSPIRLGKPTLLKSAHFVLNHAKGDSLLFRLKLYRFGPDGAGEPLLTENILIREVQRPGTVSINLSPYDLILEGDILLALEWLHDYDELGNQGITFDTRRGKSLKGIYARLWSTGPLRRLDNLGGKNVCFYLKGKRVR